MCTMVIRMDSLLGHARMKAVDATGDRDLFPRSAPRLGEKVDARSVPRSHVAAAMQLSGEEETQEKRGAAGRGEARSTDTTSMKHGCPTSLHMLEKDDDTIENVLIVSGGQTAAAPLGLGPGGGVDALHGVGRTGTHAHHGLCSRSV